MNKFFPYLFLLLLPYLTKLNAQNNTNFALELSTGIGFTNFRLGANISSIPGINVAIDLSEHVKTKGALSYNFGIGTIYDFSNRIDIRLQVLLSKGAFQYRKENLIFASDIINAMGGEPKSSTITADFDFLTVEIPLTADLYLSAKPTAFYLTIGGGGIKRISSKGIAQFLHSDGRIEELEAPSYQSIGGNAYGLIGLGKKWPLPKSNSLHLRIEFKHYVLEETLSPFDIPGRQINANMVLAYRL